MQNPKIQFKGQNFPDREKEILKFWEESRIFERILKETKRGKRFVFYEGPPTANGMPHIGHAMTRAFKDVVLRYKTMRGYYVPRRAGWDTHGLPVEIEVEKALGFKTKHDIERYGVGRFNQKAKESVWQYKDEWERFTKRMGFWIDMEHPYITYETSYIEALWSIVKEIWKKKLLYRDFKVVPFCPRCQTGLSSHELGQDAYKKVKDDSVFVRFPLKGKKRESLLIWTTTPWTLPANVAVAVHPKLEYTKYKLGDEFVWSAVTPPHEAGTAIEVIEKVLGNRLVGLEYEPPFVVNEKYRSAAPPPFIVVAADFVTLDEGTGMVHIAPAYGEEDMACIKQYAKGKDYPVIQTVNLDGTMKSGLPGSGKFVKDADKDIIEDLSRRRLLFKKMPYEHDYPHCWRCKTPLLYFAKNGWWIAMSRLKKALMERNETINWVPEHLKNGRFGEFLREVRDWAFSRDRFWGTPLPLWHCDGCDTEEVIGSRSELLKKLPKSRNQYFLMRHGEAISNIRHVADSGDRNGLTLRGRLEVEKAARRLKRCGIDMIYTSPFKRTRESADIVAKALGVGVYPDARLREINVGSFDNRPTAEYHHFFATPLEKFTKRPPEGENLGDLRARMLEAIMDMEKKYNGKKILIISHEYPLWMLYAGSGGMTNEEAVRLRRGRRASDFIRTAEVMAMHYAPWPRDETGEVNLHRPYIDEIIFECPQCKEIMRRVPEVADVWFDSGAMPFAANASLAAHLKNLKSTIRKLNEYPADYIVEAIDQTRGWFYTLLAVATLLGKGAPYKNVISLGHVLDKNGQKMSKSKGNVVDPGAMMEQYGADALRWYFYTVNAPGDVKRFNEKDLFDAARGFVGTLWNVFVFFDTYVSNVKISTLAKTSTDRQTSILDIPRPDRGKLKHAHILDRWLMGRLGGLAREMSDRMDAYDITNAARRLEEFVIKDFSQWFVRRSRRRFQHPESKKEFDEAAAMLALSLSIVARLAAPFVPFLAEALWQGLRKKGAVAEISVHAAPWPRGFKARASEMERVRELASEALKLRAALGIRVRQPLRMLRITDSPFKEKGAEETLREEVNVKEIVFNADQIELDTVLTPELKEEGVVREFIRNVQELRRDLSLTPRHVIKCQISGDRAIEDILSRHETFIRREVHARTFRVGGKKEFKAEREVDIEGKTLWIGIS